MANLSKEVETKTNGAAHSMSSELQKFGNTVEKLSHDVGSQIGSLTGDVSGRITEYVKTTRSYVKEHPIQSVAIAAVAGVAVGSLFTKARSK